MAVKLGWLDSVCHCFHHQGKNMFVVQIVFFYLYFETTMKAYEIIKQTRRERWEKKHTNTNASVIKKNIQCINHIYSFLIIINKYVAILIFHKPWIYHHSSFLNSQFLSWSSTITLDHHDFKSTMALIFVSSLPIIYLISKQFHVELLNRWCSKLS